jgi:DNA adenine methylase
MEMKRDKLVMPVVKWLGGKRQLLPTLVPLLPDQFSNYCEPFFGGGAMFFWIQPMRAIVNDINSDLMQVYEVIRDDVENLISELEKNKNESEYFYKIRVLDRNKDSYNKLSPAEKASRVIFLNKTCFNGLFRVNNAGEFNSPFGNYKNPNIVNANTLRAVSNYFNRSEITFSCCDYSDVLKRISEGTFVYLDPPYDPVSTTANFTGYSRGGFFKDDQVRLRECCDDLNRRGIKFMLSNSATDFIKKQYSSYNIKIVRAKRTINSDATGRGQVDELVVRNYE